MRLALGRWPLQLFLSGLFDKGQDDYIEIFYLFQLIVLEIMRNLLAFSYFPTYNEI